MKIGNAVLKRFCFVSSAVISYVNTACFFFCGRQGSAVDHMKLD